MTRNFRHQGAHSARYSGETFPGQCLIPPCVLVRSEQTDMMDLLGADLPAEDGAAGDFRWADGPLLSAIKVR